MDSIQICILIFWNLIVFGLFGADKCRAKKEMWRTKESTLIICAYAMGAVGAALGMYVFNHKTSKKWFGLLISIAIIVNVTGFVLLGRI